MSSILVTGSQGLLAQSILSIQPLADISLDAPLEGDFDITNTDRMSDYIAQHGPYDFIVNCAAYTHVDQSEDDYELAEKINTTGVENLITVCKVADIKLIHVSTDMVFTYDNKNHGMYTEDTPTNPVNAYGRTKALAEKIITETYSDHSWIVRTAWLYGGETGKKGFVNKVIEWAQNNNTLSIVDDEIGTPTYAHDLAMRLIFLINHSESYEPGIYHAVNEGLASRYDVAMRIKEILGLDNDIKKAKLSDFNRKAMVSHNSVLQNTKSPALRHWDEALTDYLTTYSTAVLPL